jgi:hypothetical protein
VELPPRVLQAALMAAQLLREVLAHVPLGEQEEPVSLEL